MINFFNVDCMDFMKSKPDGFYDLAIVDPPYGLGDRLVDGGTKKNPMQKYRKDYESKRWDVVPEEDYFKELFRISKNQIIWGANYFLEYLPSTRGIICWDKKQMMETLSRWEFAWTSFDKVAKTYEKRSQDIERIHINQKPVDLYRWLVLNYAKHGDKILDTHGGSMTNAIACDIEGFDLDICEIDKEYFDKGIETFNIHKMQFKLGDSPKERGEKNLIQLGLSFPKSDETGI